MKNTTQYVDMVVLNLIWMVVSALISWLITSNDWYQVLSFLILTSIMLLFSFGYSIILHLIYSRERK